jgi:hypothetical protein
MIPVGAAAGPQVETYYAIDARVWRNRLAGRPVADAEFRVRDEAVRAGRELARFAGARHRVLEPGGVPPLIEAYPRIA